MIVRDYFESALGKFIVPIGIVLNAPYFSPDLFCIRVRSSFSLLGNVVLLGQLKDIELFLPYF